MYKAFMGFEPLGHEKVIFITNYILIAQILSSKYPLKRIDSDLIRP